MATPSFHCKPQSLAYDVAIVGGATSGSAIAWFLASNADFHGTVLVVERDPSLKYSATQASNNCMRQQFATDINIKIAQYGAEFVKNFRKNLASSDDDGVPDLPIRNFGYLYLADNPEFVATLQEDQELQAACGAGTHMLSTEQIAAQYPFFALDDIEAGSLNTVDEGAFDALQMVESLRNKATQHGVEYVHNEVVALNHSGNKIHSITLKTGEVVRVGTVVNAAGTRAAQVSRLAGVDLPIEARRRYTFIFSVDEPLPQDLPLTIDPTGVHLRSYGEKDYLVGCPPIGPDLAIAVDDFSYEEGVWTQKVLPVLTKRVPQFASAKVTNSWVGHYEFNTFDHNAIIGPHTDIKNLLFCVGFSGHGSQQAPACGRGVAELITYGSFRSLDLSALSYARIQENKPLWERAVI
ncbi:FAD dependent oxidoreductase [Cordyceps fumosorosea ARSEF 2679]|uniref:FAD-dependent oxidoreductase domain-containing protein 1 n=1 Tax=Cordyceps fumosorosea (strain ARSEF 2679) TaxID=1081104 RepID=A0A167PZI1_CORFA|nr:FAD dependent oxidoreductase [Cordyceps fumosorosea ARSEF 2679]OAA57157.1 FAD dependent oxidoreductase [Cordyceps fumosorosea ARSEF 2679]